MDMNHRVVIKAPGRVIPIPLLPDSPIVDESYQPLKRLFDLILCLLALPIVMPLGIIIAIAIRLDSPGPILFLQERVGKDGRLFKIVKFRTMHRNIDKRSHRAFMKKYISGQMRSNGDANNTFKPFKDNEVTSIGRFLRRTSLDELPQLINVFRHEMTFVGPRPNVTWEVESYREWHAERLRVLPGITGLAQVRGRSTITFDEIVQHDLEYIEKQGLWLDIRILWWTVTSVLFRNGAE